MWDESMWGLAAAFAAAMMFAIIVIQIAVLWCIDGDFRRDLARDALGAFERRFRGHEEDGRAD